MTDEIFKRKYSLLDTNILSEMVRKEGGSEPFRPVFDFLSENEISPFILEATKFEFVGYSTNAKDFNKLKQWIDTFPALFNLQPEDYAETAKLSAMYKCKNPSINPKQISFVDCLYAWQIIKYKGRAFVVTTDINDYPSFLFDSPRHFPVEHKDGTTSFVAFKTYNEEKYKKLVNHFEQSG